VTSALDDLRNDVVVCRRCPRLVAWREQVAREKVARFADSRTGGGRCRDSGTRTRGSSCSGSRRRARRQPDGEDLHGRSLGGLPVRGAASRRLREPAVVHVRGRRPPSPWRLPQRGEPMRSAGEPPDPRGTRSLPPVPRAGARRPLPRARDRSVGSVRVGWRAARGRRSRPRHAASETAVRSWGGSVRRPLSGPRKLPPEPTEHVHGEAHRAMLDAIFERARELAGVSSRP
jgi:hypothetical protein